MTGVEILLHKIDISKYISIIFLGVILSTGISYCEETKNIAVLRITSGILGEQDLNILNKKVLETFKSMRMHNIIAGDELVKLLGEEYLTKIELCEEVYCLIETGQKLGVNEVVSGSIDLKENNYLVNITRTGVKEGTISAKHSENCMSYSDLSTCLETAIKKVYNYKPMGLLILYSVPPGANVKLNGRNEGETPLKKWLPAGNYELILTKNGYCDERRFVKIEDNTQAETFIILEEFTGSKISIETEPEDASVYIDNMYAGTTPYSGKNFRSGKHEIRIEKEYYEPVRKSVEIAQGSHINISEKLKHSRAYFDSIRRARKVHKYWGYSVLGISGLSFASSVYFKVLADRAYKDYRNSFNQNEIDRSREEFKHNLTYMNITLGVGVALAGTSGIIFLSVPDIPQEEEVNAGAILSPEEIKLFAEIKF